MAGKKVSSLRISKQSGVDRTYFATWSFSHAHLDSYSVEWQYCVNGTWFEGSSGSSGTSVRSNTYSAPDNALKIRVRVKPVSKKHKKNKKEVSYFTGSWCSWVTQNMPSSTAVTPDTPSAPDVELNKFKLKASVTVTDTKTDEIVFQIVRNDSTIAAEALPAPVKYQKASIEWNGVTAGDRFKVRCYGRKNTSRQVATGEYTYGVYRTLKEAKKADKQRNTNVIITNGNGPWYGRTAITTTVKSTINGDWSPYSSDVNAPPPALKEAPLVVAISAVSFEVSWNAVSTADKYVVEYTTNRDYFDIKPDAVESKEITNGTRAEIDVQASDTYYFRVKVVDASNQESGWSPIAEQVTGKVPNAPTTWSSTSTTCVGRDVTLYWTHNAADGSREREAILTLLINGVDQHLDPIPNEAIGNQFLDDTGTYSYLLETDKLTEGAKIEWCVRTRGVLEEYGPDSVTREINVYAPPSLTMSLGSQNQWAWDTFNFTTDDINTAYGELMPLENTTLRTFPLYVQLNARPETQTPVTYYISIVSNETYEDVDEIGETIRVNAGDELFSKFYESSSHWLTAMISAADVNLDTGHSYTIRATVAMDSGLSGDTEVDNLLVDWDDEEYDIDVEDVGVDADVYACYLRPYCNDENDDPVEDVLLSVYRRTFDGEFVLIAGAIDNTIQPTIVDPHPGLDYGRYRIVAQSKITGRVFFYDAPPIPIGETSIILQWDELTYALDTDEEEQQDQLPYTGKILKLPWNVDVSESNDKDVEHVAYIGRQHPVSYYGTQVGQKGSWKASIDKYDSDTIDLLRQLAVYMGDVYVREPGGSGYWATVSVSFNRDHNSVITPVSIEVTRVEGGA